MASGDHRPDIEHRDAQHLVVGVIRTQWNTEIVDRLVEGAQRAIEASGAASISVTVPGAFELPFAARALITSGKVNAVVVLGAVVRGETTHYEIVSEGCAQGVMQVQLSTGVPIGMGVLTVENEDQALARSQPEGGHNVGEEATLAAIDMTLLAERHRA